MKKINNYINTIVCITDDKNVNLLFIDAILLTSKCRLLHKIFSNHHIIDIVILVIIIILHNL